MAKLETIKSYLVSLGFAVTDGELRKFKDTLKDITQDVERVAAGMTKGFAVAGATIAGVLTGIGVGVLDLMNNTARADLGFQVFARRMYMGVDAAKQMKIATEALGYSLEDIIWGPKELRDRYGTLIADQRKMNAGLGPDFETQMKRIRDIRFEFTRMGVEVEYFGMQLTRSLMDKLFGGADSLDKRLDQLNTWFQSHIPQLADNLAKGLAPIMKQLGFLADKIFTQKNMDWVLNVTVKGLENLNLFIDWLRSNDKLGALSMGSVGKTISGMMGLGDRDDNIGKIMKAAREQGLDASHVLALFDQETGGKFNANAVGPVTRSGKQALGLGQLMPDKIPAGADPFDADTNISLTLSLLKRLLKANGGDWQGTMNDYYGHGSPLPGQPSFQQYWKGYQDKERAWERQNKKQSYGAYEQMGMKGGAAFGDIIVNVAHTNASPEDIANAVVHKVEDRMGRRVQDNLTQFTGVYA